MRFIETTPFVMTLVIAISIATSCSAFSKASVLNLRYNRGSSTTTSSAAKSNTKLEVFRFGSDAATAASTTTPEEASSLSSSSLQSNIFDPVTDICIAALRIGTCALMFHHGIDKVDNVEGFSVNVVSKFFGFLPGDPSYWTLSAAGTQIVGSILLAVGIFARPVAISMCATMLTAVIFHLLNTGSEGFPLAVVPQHSYNFELAAMYVAVLTYFSAAGAGAYSVDEQIFGGELKLYGSVIDNIFGGDGTEEEEAAAPIKSKGTTDAYVQNSKSFQFPWSK